MNLIEFGAYLTKIREQNGYKSQRQLAIEANISSATLSRIESGIQKAQPETLLALSKVLNDVSYHELLHTAGYLDQSPLLEPAQVNKMFSNHITELRKQRGLTQQEAAEKLQLARSTYVGYEIGKREPTFQTLIHIADFYGVSTDYLLGHHSIERQQTSLDIPPAMQAQIEKAINERNAKLISLFEGFVSSLKNNLDH